MAAVSRRAQIGLVVLLVGSLLTLALGHYVLIGLLTVVALVALGYDPYEERRR
jgi:hypothetical protein